MFLSKLVLKANVSEEPAFPSPSCFFCVTMHHFIENWGMQILPCSDLKTPFSSMSGLEGCHRRPTASPGAADPAKSFCLPSHFFAVRPVVSDAALHLLHRLSHSILYQYFSSDCPSFLDTSLTTMMSSFTWFFFLIPIYCQFRFHCTLQNKYGRKVWQSRYLHSAGKWNLTYWSHLFLLQLGEWHFTGRHLSYDAFIHFFHSTPTYLP